VTRAAAWKIVASVVVIAGVVGFLLLRSSGPNQQLYKHVDELMTNVASFHGKRLQVHGYVVEGSIENKPGTLEYRFQIESREPRPHAVIGASYTGLVPDPFKNGAEVVATGMLGDKDRLDVIPDGIMAKCPSKYEADKAGNRPMPAAMPAAMPGAAQGKPMIDPAARQL